MSEFALHADYRKPRGLTDEKYNALAFTDLNTVTTLSETTTKEHPGIASPSIRANYFGLDGKPTGHRRWRLLGTSAPRKFHQLPGTGNHPYFPLLGAKSKKRWARIAKDPKERIVITEGEFKAAAAALAGIVTVGIGGVDSWHETGNKKLLAELLLINWNKRPVDLVPDADHATNPNVRRAFLDFADALTERGAVVRIRILTDVCGNNKTGLDDYLAKHSAREFEKLPAFGMDSDLIKEWRQDLLDGSELPDFDLVPLDPAWLDEPLPPLEYTVAGLIPRGTVVLMVAEGGVGKTFLALELVCATASGDAFLGLPTRRGAVVYLGLEDPPEILRRRIYNALARRLADLRARVDRSRSYEEKVKGLRLLLLENLRVVSLAGQELHLVGLKGGVVVQSPALDELIERLRGEPIELLILDPMARLHGTDENANATGTAVVNAAERIAREVGCTVCILHHTGKSAATRDDQYAARGASGLADAARVVLRLRGASADELKRLSNATQEEIDRGVLRLIHAKCNYAPRLVNGLWLKRSLTGGLDVFTPAFNDADDDHATTLARLRAWATAAFTEGEVRVKSGEIFGEKIGHDTASEFFTRAEKDGDIIATGKKRKGGKLYEIATAKATTNDD